MSVSDGYYMTLLFDNIEGRSSIELKEGQVLRKPLRQPGSLEIIENGEEKNERERPPSESSSRSWSRASVGSIPPRSESSLSRRTATPTKQISLQAVRRKEESSDPFIDNIDIDLESVTFDSSRPRARKWVNDDDFRPLSENSFVEDESIDSTVAEDYKNISNGLELEAASSSSIENRSIERKLQSDTLADGARNEPMAKAQSSRKPGQSKNEESSSEEDDDEDEEAKMRAPNELLMEFVDCLMKKDFPNADKLCKMILLYEPDNPEALKFQPLITEKMQLDAEAAEEGESDDEDDSDDSDDSDDDDDDDDDDDTSSSDDDSSEESDDDREGNDKPGNVPSTSSMDPVPHDIKGTNSIRVWKPAS